MSTAPTPAPSACAACGEAASATLTLRECTHCRSVAYCGRACQRSHRRQHSRRCKQLKAERLFAEQTTRRPPRFQDMAAVRASVSAGADVEAVDEHDGATIVFGAAQCGRLDVLVFLVEERGASLRARDLNGESVMHRAARHGHSDVVRYVAKRAPELLNVADLNGLTPLMAASQYGGVQGTAVEELTRLGCDLALRNDYGNTARDWARHNDHHDTARLLSDIDAAGGWRPYAAACRMAYVRIRHEVSKTYAVLDEGHDDRALLHFLFGRNRAIVAAAVPTSHGERLEEASEDGAEKPEAMLELPDVVFRLVCRYLEGWPAEAEVRLAAAEAEEGFVDERR